MCDIMARTFLDTLRAAVRRYGLLVPGDTVVAAVSGGADSVALLLGLLALRESYEISVVAAHLDHGLRGAEGAGDRRFVEELAERLAVPCITDAGTVAPGNLEAEARRVRYTFLEHAADRMGATKIATGHTLDDQAETVLLRLLRGAGRRGLGGIRPRRGMIIRPLLHCSRVQVRTFLVERGVTWRRDHSNFDLATERARVRHGFLPALRHEFNPRLASTLADLADAMREEDALLDRLAAAAARRASLECPVLTALEDPLARRAVRQWWRRYGTGRRLGRTHVAAVLALAARAAGDGEIAVPGGAIVRTGHSLRLRLGAEEAGDATPWERGLVLGTDLETPGGWCLRLLECAPGTAQPSAEVCMVDADRVGPLAVRNRRVGDRIRVLGLGGRAGDQARFSSRAPSRAGSGRSIPWSRVVTKSSGCRASPAASWPWWVQRPHAATSSTSFGGRMNPHDCRAVPPMVIWPRSRADTQR